VSSFKTALEARGNPLEVCVGAEEWALLWYFPRMKLAFWQNHGSHAKPMVVHREKV
jgi:hypothetical protein